MLVLRRDHWVVKPISRPMVWIVSGGQIFVLPEKPWQQLSTWDWLLWSVNVPRQTDRSCSSFFHTVRRRHCEALHLISSWGSHYSKSSNYVAGHLTSTFHFINHSYWLYYNQNTNYCCWQQWLYSFQGNLEEWQLETWTPCPYWPRLRNKQLIRTRWHQVTIQKRTGAHRPNMSR